MPFFTSISSFTILSNLISLHSSTECSIDLLDLNKEVSVRILEVIKKIIKCDEERLLGEYTKLLTPVLNCTKSSNKKISNEAFKVYSLLTGYSTKETLDKVDEDVIKKCIDNYCNNKDLEVLNATQSLIRTYVSKGDKKDMEKLVNPELLKNVILNLTVDNISI
jgi:hypothetical protein